MELADVAARITGLGDDVAGEASRLADLDPAARAFAADGGGALFAAGAALRAHWQGALAARERELGGQGDRLLDLAAALRRAADNYAAAEQSSHQAHQREAS